MPKEREGPAYEEVDHTADWAFRVRAEDLPSLFAQAAQGLYALVGARPRGKDSSTRHLALHAIDSESLLVAWLNELLFLHDQEGLLFTQFRWQHFGETSLAVELVGVPSGPWIKDVKAVTYSNLRIAHDAQGYETTLVLDV